MFTRLIFSVLATGLVPTSFYPTDVEGRRQRSHYDGLLVGFVAEAISTLGAEADIPQLARDFIEKYAWDLRLLKVLTP